MKFQFLLTSILVAIPGCSILPVSQTSVSPQSEPPKPTLVSSLVPPATADQTISESGIGPAKFGMTLGELKRQMGESHKFAVTSPFIVDFDAIAVSKGGKVEFYILYPAKTTLADSQPIEILMTDSTDFRTAEGVGAGTLIKEAEAVYGKATLAYSTENESREYVSFANKTSRKIAFRAGGIEKRGFAGIYPLQNLSYHQTTKYVDGAFIRSIEVLPPVQGQNLSTEDGGRKVAQRPWGCATKAMTINTYETENFAVYICTNRNGELYYQGLSKHNGALINVFGVRYDVGNQTHTAINGDHTYQINPNVLKVYEGDRVILNEPVIKYSPGGG